MAKKEKLSKAEKKEAKALKKAERAQNPDSVATKQTVIKAVTAVICVGALCISSSSAIGKYCDALGKAAETQASIAPVYQQGGTAVSAPVNSGVPGGTDAPVVDDTQTPADTQTPTDDTQTPTDTQAPADNGGEKSNDPTTYNKAQVVEYYNKCLKDSYAKNVKVDKTDTINIRVDEATGGDIVKNFVNNTILPKYAGTKTYTKTFTNGKSGDETITGFASRTGLTPDGAKTATIVKSGSNYVITIVTVAEKSTLETPPTINKACSHPLDLATVDISPAKVTKADFTYPGTTLKATVDANGKVLQTSINQPLSGTGEGKLGLTLHATLSGSLDQTCKYTYM